MKIEKQEKIIEIQEEVKISQNDQNVILEKGDKIELLKEYNYYSDTFNSITRSGSKKDLRIKISGPGGESHWMDLNDEFLQEFKKFFY